jgi:hypothetical protein
MKKLIVKELIYKITYININAYKKSGLIKIILDVIIRKLALYFLEF